jgi:hypothetical protein
MNCFNQRTGTTHSVPGRSPCALSPVLSLRRRLFLTVESTAVADYQRDEGKGELQRNLCQADAVFLTPDPCRLLFEYPPG